MTADAQAPALRQAYTRFVGNWARRTAGFLVLVVMGSAPAMATACALLCDARADETTAAHQQHGQPPHGAAVSCHDAPAPDGPVVSGVTTDCALHHDGPADAVALMASRADVGIVTAPPTGPAPHVAAPQQMLIGRVDDRHGHPPDRPPAALAALALRI